jgi:predicted Zn finger-like uncharacterized protein
MQAACSKCGTQHLLKDAQIGDQAKVQFRCSKCGETTVVEVERRTDRTQVITPMPSFARRGGSAGLGDTMASEYQGLALPVGKAITLSVIAGPAKGLVYPITKPRVVIGRTGADLEINDPEVSRWHCAVEVKGDVIRLRDLDSTNGTYYGEERVRAAELKHLCEFRIGSTVVLVTVIPRLAG